MSSNRPGLGIVVPGAETGELGVGVVEATGKAKRLKAGVREILNKSLFVTPAKAGVQLNQYTGGFRPAPE